MSERSNASADCSGQLDQPAERKTFTMEQLLGCVGMVAVAFAAFRAVMWAGGEHTILAVMIFCTAIGGAIGILRGQFVEGCAMGWIGFVIGIFVLIFLLPGVH